MLWCLKDIYSLNEWADQGDSKSSKISSAHLLLKVILNSLAHLLSQFSSWYEREMLANIGPRGDSIATLSTWI